jgi:hypothetical protein
MKSRIRYFYVETRKGAETCKWFGWDLFVEAAGEVMLALFLY